MDLETSPNIAFCWRAGSKNFINPDGIIKERKIICIGYKWEHEQDAHVLIWNERQSDKEILKQFLVIANQADEIVAHWGDRFDLPWFRTRCLFHGLAPLPTYKTIDTCAWARRLFYFNSCKLNYIAKFLGLGEKKETSHNLWVKVVLENDQESLVYMADYCKQDILLLEKVYHRLSEVAAPKSHAGVMAGNDRWSCPHCASLKVKKDKTRVTAAGTVQHQMACNSCHKYFQINEATYKRYLQR